MIQVFPARVFNFLRAGNKAPVFSGMLSTLNIDSYSRTRSPLYFGSNGDSANVIPNARLSLARACIDGKDASISQLIGFSELQQLFNHPDINLEGPIPFEEPPNGFFAHSGSRAKANSLLGLLFIQSALDNDTELGQLLLDYVEKNIPNTNTAPGSTQYKNRAVVESLARVEFNDLTPESSYMDALELLNATGSPLYLKQSAVRLLAANPKLCQMHKRIQEFLFKAYTASSFATAGYVVTGLMETPGNIDQFVDLLEQNQPRNFKLHGSIVASLLTQLTSREKRLTDWLWSHMD